MKFYRRNSMSKYFLSFTSTFESLLSGKITMADLSAGTLVFGCKREHVLLPYDLIPIEVTWSNTVKPKHGAPGEHSHDKSNTVRRDRVDHPALKVWDAFASQIRKASTEGRLIFLRDIGHPSYQDFIEDVLRPGDQALWRGQWATLGETVHAVGTQNRG
jgi:hypothetical protein